MRLLKLTLLFFFLFTSLDSEGQDTTTPIQKEPRIENDASVDVNRSQDDDGLTETQAYKMLYENAKESNEKILGTIYWALGGIATVILAIIGSSIFFNFRFNKKEVEKITSETLSKLESAKNDYQSEIETKFDDYKTKTQEDIKKEQQDLTDKYQDLLKSYSDNLSSQIDSNKKIVDNELELILKGIKTLNENVGLSIELAKKELKVASKKLERRIAHNEAEHWKNKGIYANALTYYIEEGFIDLEIGYNWAIEYLSKDIIEALKNMSFIMESDSKQLKKLLDKFPKEYLKQKKEIEELVNQLKPAKG